MGMAKDIKRGASKVGKDKDKDRGRGWDKTGDDAEDILERMDKIGKKISYYKRFIAGLTGEDFTSIKGLTAEFYCDRNGKYQSALEQAIIHHMVFREPVLSEEDPEQLPDDVGD